MKKMNEIVSNSEKNSDMGAEWESVGAVANGFNGENCEIASEVKVRTLDPKKDDLAQAAN